MTSLTKPVVIGNDHGGYALKLELIAWLVSKGIPVEDIGSHTADIVRYPNLATELCARIQSGEFERGILLCSTGIGMSIIANRHHGIRASLCTSTYMAKMTRAHNDSNVLVLGGKITGAFEALDILETWLQTSFEGGRHCLSLDLIRAFENANAKDHC